MLNFLSRKKNYYIQAKVEINVASTTVLLLFHLIFLLFKIYVIKLTLFNNKYKKVAQKKFSYLSPITLSIRKQKNSLYIKNLKALVSSLSVLKIFLLHAKEQQLRTKKIQNAKKMYY